MYFGNFMYSVGLCFVKFGYKFSLVVAIGVPTLRDERNFCPYTTAIVESKDGLANDRLFKRISHVLFFFFFSDI